MVIELLTELKDKLAILAIINTLTESNNNGFLFNIELCICISLGEWMIVFLTPTEQLVSLALATASHILLCSAFLANKQ